MRQERHDDRRLAPAPLERLPHQRVDYRVSEALVTSAMFRKLCASVAQLLPVAARRRGRSTGPRFGRCGHGRIIRQRGVLSRAPRG